MEGEKRIIVHKKKDGSVQLEVNLQDETLWL